MQVSYLKSSVATLCLLLSFAAGKAVHAQEMENLISNVDKARYNFAPLGLRSGSLIFSPGISLDEIYEDNVYRTSQDEQSDIVSVIRPSIGIATDLDMHALYFRAGGSLGYYKDNDSENYKDYSLGGGGRFDLDYATFLNYGASYKSSHEGRDSVDDPNAVEPVEYTLLTHNLGFTRALGLIKLNIEGVFDSFQFGDAKMQNGGTIDNSGRNRNIYAVNTKLAYEYFPGYNVYTALRYDQRRYDREAAVSRDSDGTEVIVGTDVELTGKMRGDVYVGMLQRDYDAEERPGIDAISYGGQLIWNMTGLTSFTASAERAVEETTYQDASGNLTTRLSLGVDHLLDHNLFLNANASMGLSDYEQDGGAELQNENYGASVGLEYLPALGTSIKLGYGYSQRESELPGEAFENNRITLSLTKRF